MQTRDFFFFELEVNCIGSFTFPTPIEKLGCIRWTRKHGKKEARRARKKKKRMKKLFALPLFPAEF